MDEVRFAPVFTMANGVKLTPVFTMPDRKVKPEFGKVLRIGVDAATYTGPTVVTPSLSSQSLATAGKLMPSDVTVEPVPMGSATTPNMTITADVDVSFNSQTGTVTSAATGTALVKPNVVEGYVTQGSYGTVAVAGTGQYQLPVLGALRHYPYAYPQTVVGAGVYVTGNQQLSGVTTSNLTAENIKRGVTVDIGCREYPSSVTSVTGTYGGTLQTKSVTPSETAQTLTPDTGYDGFSQVSVGAISPTYVGSDIPRRQSLAVNGSAVTAAAGYYAQDTTAQVDVANIPTPSISINAGTVTATNTVTQGGYMQTGTETATATIPSASYSGGIRYNSSDSKLYMYVDIDDDGWIDSSDSADPFGVGTSPASLDPNLREENIKAGVNIFGKTGTYNPAATHTIHLSNSGYSDITVTPLVAGVTTVDDGDSFAFDVSYPTTLDNTGSIEVYDNGVARAYTRRNSIAGTVTENYILNNVVADHTITVKYIPTGSLTISSNGTHDVTNYANAVVNVSSGGASNFVEGTFTTPSTAGASSITIPYTGSGYPVMAYVVVDGGAYVSGTGWYNSMQRYAIGVWAMSKAVFSSAPTYTTSGAANQGVTMSIYKNSTTSSTSYTRTSAMTTNVFSSSNATNAAATAIRFKTGNVLSYYTNTSSYGLLPNTAYRYFIVYSS